MLLWQQVLQLQTMEVVRARTMIDHLHLRITLLYYEEDANIKFFHPSTVVERRWSKILFLKSHHGQWLDEEVESIWSRLLISGSPWNFATNLKIFDHPLL